MTAWEWRLTIAAIASFGGWAYVANEILGGIVG